MNEELVKAAANGDSQKCDEILQRPEADVSIDLCMYVCETKNASSASSNYVSLNTNVYFKN